MSSELNRLFEQISRSERHSRVAIDHLRSLGTRVLQSQLELQQIKDDVHSREGELAVKNNKLFDLEVEVKFLEVRVEIQRDREDSVKKWNCGLSVELVGKRSEYERVKNLAVAQFTNFSHSYDLLTWGCQYRQKETRLQVNLLQEEQIFLETDLDEIAAQRDQFENVMFELAAVQQRVQQQKTEVAKLESIKQKQELETEQLQQEKILNENLANNLEFVRLQKELVISKDCPQEMDSTSLRKELREFQCKCYRKQMKQQLQYTSQSTAGQSVDANAVGTQRSATCTSSKREVSVDGCRQNTYEAMNDDLLMEHCLDMLDIDSDGDTCTAGVDSVGDFDSILRHNSNEEIGDSSTSSAQEKNDVPVRNCIRRKSNVAYDMCSTSGASIPFKQPKARAATNFPLQTMSSKECSQGETLFHASSSLQSANAELLLSNRLVSPDCGLVSRKKPGQSICKAAGVQSVDLNFVKRTKKVRFQY